MNGRPELESLELRRSAVLDQRCRDAEAGVDQTTTFDHTCMNVRVCQERTSRMRPCPGSGYDRQI